MINNIINNKKDNNYSPRAALLLTSYTFLVSTSCIFDEWILFTNSQEVHFTEKMLAKPIIDSDIVSVKFNSLLPHLLQPSRSCRITSPTSTTRLPSICVFSGMPDGPTTAAFFFFGARYFTLSFLPNLPLFFR